MADFGDIIQAEQAIAYPATSVTVNIASATAGNLLVCTHFTGDGNSTAPSGFTEAVAVTDGIREDALAIYWKIAAGGETSVAPGSDASDEHGAAVIEIEGPWESSPVDKTATNDATMESTTSSGTTATTSQADEVAVCALSTRSLAPGYSSWTNSFLEQEDIEMANKITAAATKLLSSTGTVETTATHSLEWSMGCVATFKKGAAAPILQRRENILLRM